ncbi:MAG: CPBP family intramembrane metalloprotease [Cyanobacteria bacterium REEB459]|nr:CPBP family intramembrane metalloprotease [Cyanobacteria bacterium REEB459]
MSKRWPGLISYLRRSPLARIMVFVALVLALWFPLAWPLYRLSEQGRLPGGDVLPMVLLYLVFLLVLPPWERYLHRSSRVWQTLGLVHPLRLWRPLRLGALMGSLSLSTMVMVELAWGWLALNPAALNLRTLVPVALGGVVTALAVGWAEELLFRGWLLAELERGFTPGLALATNSVIFALAHFIKPLDQVLATWPQFLGLALLGMTLVWARRIQFSAYPGETSLGASIGLHSSLVWTYYVLNVAHLTQPTGQVPPWVTGVQGNPLAGLTGLCFLIGLLVVFYRLSRQPISAG